jgi:hypothetical protein
MRRVSTIRADFAVVPPVGTATLQPLLIFHPPSLRNPNRIPVDDPRETLDTFFDVFQRTSLRTWRYRMELLRHAQPSEPPWAVKTLVEHPMNYLAGLNLWGAADDIARAARRVYGKHTGKARGLFVIEQDLRDTITSRFLKYGDWDKHAAKRVDDYIDERMGFLSTAFRGLNSPMTDRSDERAERIGDFEHRSAVSDVCLENADEGPIPVGEDFPSGDYSAPAHLFCRCGVEYVEDEE